MCIPSGHFGPVVFDKTGELWIIAKAGANGADTISRATTAYMVLLVMEPPNEKIRFGVERKPSVPNRKLDSKGEQPF